MHNVYVLGQRVEFRILKPKLSAILTPFKTIDVNGVYK